MSAPWRRHAAPPASTRSPSASLASAAPVALWRFAPQLSAWYAASVGTLDPMLLGFGSLAVTTVALWTLLRRFDVDPRSLVGA